jgi:hypothetical protein
LRPEQVPTGRSFGSQNAALNDAMRASSPEDDDIAPFVTHPICAARDP